MGALRDKGYSQWCVSPFCRVAENNTQQGLGSGCGLGDRKHKIIDARETGLSIPTNIHNGRYTLLVDHTLYKNDKEYEADKWGYEVNGKTLGFGDRVNIKVADTSNINNLLAHIHALKNDKKEPGRS